MGKIRLTVDNKPVEVNEGTTVLQAAREAGIYIPTLCYHPSLPSDGNCGLCLVEIEGRRDSPLACTTTAAEGMTVSTQTPQIRKQQREALKRLLAKHPCACLTCDRRLRCQPYDICLRNVDVSQRCVLCAKNGHCELQKVADYFDLEGEDFSYCYRNIPVDTENPLYERDYNLCISCSRCVRMCQEVRGIGAIKMGEHNGERLPEPSDGKSLASSGCRYCRACVEVCPTAALMDREAKWDPCVEREAVVAACKYACPAHIDVPRYVYFTGEGRFADALGIVREKVPFPGALGRVCIHPCEGACKRGSLNEAISIKSLKRFLADRDTGEWKKYSKKLPPADKKVAVVGAGPAGLTAAYYLAKAGHAVTVFEELPVAGGMMRVGIPDYRLPTEVLEGEIDVIRKAGVEIKTNTRIESVEALLEQGFDAVFVGVGAHKGLKMGAEGEDTPGVMEGASFLRKANLGEKVNVGNSVAVVGGGNVAIDSARVALRLGARDVSIIYRRTRDEMPASAEEVEAALHEDIKITYLAAPEKIERVNGKLRMTCIRMKLGEPDASGRRRPEPVKGSQFTMDFDSIIPAIGQQPDIPAKFNLKLGRGNTFQVDPETMATSKKGVYAGGDSVSGPASVIEAIAAGRKAASAIDKYLGGSGDITEELVKERSFNLNVGKCADFAPRTRAHMAELTKEQRAGNFREVELGFTEQEAVNEGKRCLQCAVRLEIPPAPLPPARVKKARRKEKVVV